MKVPEQFLGNVDGKPLTFHFATPQAAMELDLPPGMNGYWKHGDLIIKDPMAMANMMGDWSAESKLPAADIVKNAHVYRKRLIEYQQSNVREELERRKKEVEADATMPAEAKKHLLADIDRSIKTAIISIGAIDPDGIVRPNAKQVEELKKELGMTDGSDPEFSQAFQMGLNPGSAIPVRAASLSTDELERELRRRKAAEAGKGSPKPKA